MYRAGMCSILSELVRQDRLTVVDDFSVDAPKTKLFSDKIKSMGLGESVLLVTDNFDENLYLSSRNLPHVLVVEAQFADPASLVHFPKVIVTKGAVKRLEEMLA
jgi:large subunit ribosomal protein L4